MLWISQVSPQLLCLLGGFLWQCWVTYQFSDHGGISQAASKSRRKSVIFSHARRPSGRKRVQPRPLVIDAAAFYNRQRMVGARVECCCRVWQIMRGITSCFLRLQGSQGVRRAELRYDLADAIQNRILDTLRSRERE